MRSSNRDALVEKLIAAYGTEQKFHTIAAIRDFLDPDRTMDVSTAYYIDLDARNLMNADLGTPTVVAAPKVPEDGKYVREPDPDADKGLARLVAFSSEAATKAINASNQAHKVSNQHPNDIDVMRLARDIAQMSRHAVSVQRTIEWIKTAR
jgi:hypothetical protein